MLCVRAVGGSSFIGTLGSFKSLSSPVIPFIYILSLQASMVTQFAHRELIQQASCNLPLLLSRCTGQLVMVFN